jgi:hydroxyacylglutathione hydrolase
MVIEQIYTGCLAHGAYYVEVNGEAAIIDPLRDVDSYIAIAKKRGSKIKYIFETHFHADFVSGHIDLSKETGAEIIYGPTEMETGFDCTIAKDGQLFSLGKATLQLIHTPGHTMESSCLLLKNESGKDVALFTGDTLFIGDVGRPDLAQHVVADLTQEKLAAHLFDSLQQKIMPLDDDIIVYPAHGAGSACGKNISKETSDTLGNQKKTNAALRPGLTKEIFVQELLHGLTPPPAYFPKNVLMNIQGYGAFEEVMYRGTRPIQVDKFELYVLETDALVLDTRNASDFAKGHIPNAINIGIDGGFAVWVGTLIPDIKQEILLVVDSGREEEVVARLARVGYDYAIGYLKGGFQSWKNAKKEIAMVQSVSAEQLANEMLEHISINIIDVRKKSEYDSEHIDEAINIPLDYINQNMGEIDPEKTYFVHCAAGYRSMAFISIMKARGLHHFIDVSGGFGSIKASGRFPISDYVCPSTML